jgi:3-oxoacyl-[acyl-carrier protein] reductase
MPAAHGAALVSGASRGLGAVIARRLAADGWPVAVNYRSELERDQAGHAVEDILARGGTAGAFAADITDEAASHVRVRGAKRHTVLRHFGQFSG